MSKIIGKIKSLYWQTIPYNYRPHNIWYKIKCWGWYRYSTVKPKTLNHTWVDRDHLLTHCMFQILVDFVEKELKYCHEERKTDHYVEVKGKRVDVRTEIYELYDWWKNVYSQYDGIKSALIRLWLNNRGNEEWVKLGEKFNGETLYEWNMPESSDPIKRKISKVAWNDLQEFEELSHKETLDRMRRLVKVSPHMWT